MTHHPFNCCLDSPKVKTKQTSEVLFCEYGRGVNAILLERKYNPRQDKRDYNSHLSQHFVIFWKNLRRKKLVVRKKPV